MWRDSLDVKQTMLLRHEIICHDVNTYHVKLFTYMFQELTIWRKILLKIQNIKRDLCEKRRMCKINLFIYLYYKKLSWNFATLEIQVNRDVEEGGLGLFWVPCHHFPGEIKTRFCIMHISRDTGLAFTGTRTYDTFSEF